MTSVLFSPFTMRGLTLANRIVVSPMCQYASEDGSATDWHIQHLGSFSLGAAALVMTEMTMVSRVGRISLQMRRALFRRERDSAEARHRFLQIDRRCQTGHPDRPCRPQGARPPPPGQGARPLKPDEGAWETLAPSPIPFGEGWHVPREMTKADMKRVTDEFVAAVQRADRVGYDLVEIHGGHGYLLSEFISPLANQRTDEYGGSAENRRRFPLEVFAACRAAWPKDKPMGIRVSSVDWVEGGTTIEDTVAYAKELKKLGCDYVDVSSGQVDLRQKIPFAPGYNAPFAEQVRREAQIPTMTVGLITQARQAEEIVASGKADLIAIGRGAMYDPRWAWHAAEELGVETEYPPRGRAAHPSMRPQVFPGRATKSA